MTIEKGKTLGIKALALAEDLTANGEKEVFFELNGQLRSVFIQDKDASKVSFFSYFNHRRLAKYEDSLETIH